MAAQTFSSPGEQETAWIANQLESARLFCEAMSPDGVGGAVTINMLELAWDNWLSLSPSDEDQIHGAINAVGCQFGQILVDQAGFNWTIVTEGNSHVLAVRALPGRGDVVVHPTSFVAKRWQRRETRFLVSAVGWIQDQVTVVKNLQQVPTKRPWWRFW